MNEDRKKHSIINILEIIIMSVGLLLFCFPRYISTANADNFDFLIVLPITLVLEIIRWFRHEI